MVDLFAVEEMIIHARALPLLRGKGDPDGAVLAALMTMRVRERRPEVTVTRLVRAGLVRAADRYIVKSLRRAVIAGVSPEAAYGAVVCADQPWWWFQVPWYWHDKERQAALKDELTVLRVMLNLDEAGRSLPREGRCDEG